MEQIPLIDLAQWTKGSRSQQLALAADVDRHLQSLGFLMVTNHGLPAATAGSARSLSRTFFDLPPDRKARYACPADAYRGWVAPGLESNNASYGVSLADAPVDLKEAYSIGPEFDGVDHFRVVEPRWYARNIWPDMEVPDYREAMLAWMQAADAVTRTILEVLSHILRLGTSWVEESCTHAIATVTVNQYPPVTEESGWRVGAHTDFGTITLLDRNDDNGLQVESEPGKWIDAPVIPGALTVNLGEMMVLLSRGRWRANPHRVVARPGAPASLSLIYFHSPNFDLSLPNEISGQATDTVGKFLGRKMDQIVRPDDSSTL